MANASQSEDLIVHLCQTSATTVFLPVVYSIMFLTGMLGNVISLWVFMRKIAFKTSTHIYLINLGISNLLLCLTMPFQAIYYSLGTKWYQHTTMCKASINVVTPVIHINICISVIIMSLVAFSRFLLLIQQSHATRPSRWLQVLPRTLLSRKRDTKLASVLSLVIWMILVLTVTSWIVLYSVKEVKSIGEEVSNATCYSVAVEVGGEGSQVYCLVAVSLFFVFFLMVIGTYLAVMKHIWRSKKSTAFVDSQRVHARVLRNIVIIKVVLVVCLMPHHIYKAIFVHILNERSLMSRTKACHPLSIYVEVKNLLLCLATLRCSTDPVMYFLLDGTFRDNTLSLLRGHSAANDSQTSNLSQLSQAKLCVIC
ncbi:hypothetical protein DNTS_035575 [Danionella cerebrum]|uniref:G-protein coupled receptors family 1 profile domain-containing protein n=1 Tax=Danionella cerebrum TaxID=2873325 RepID=A0A553NKX0_9TELE|nr:hypothetical protein DNTS_035575 [Danionella translucida]